MKTERGFTNLHQLALLPPLKGFLGGQQFDTGEEVKCVV